MTIKVIERKISGKKRKVLLVHKSKWKEFKKHFNVKASTKLALGSAGMAGIGSVGFLTGHPEYLAVVLPSVAITSMGAILIKAVEPEPKSKSKKKLSRVM